MFVRFTPKVPHTKVIPLLPTKAEGNKTQFDNDIVTLRPGTNELTEKEWEAIQPHIQNQLGKEIVAFTVEAKEKKDGKAKTLKDVPVATARKIITECRDPKTLRKWFNQELPDEMLLMVSKQMHKLKIEPEDTEDGNDGLKDSDITPEGGTPKEEDTEDDEDKDVDDTEDDGGNEIPDLDEN